MSNNAAILIPARLGSTRFPNKPLADIKGKPMIVRVCEQAAKAGFSNINVACCEDETKSVVEQAGYNAVMTDPDLPSGTDRIYQAMQKIKQDAEIIVNLQGDLPDIDPSIISKTVEALTNSPAADIATAVVAIKEKELEDDPNVVKAVVNFAQGEFSEVHYFSRSKVPANVPVLYEHIGLYVYHKTALERFVKLEQSYFEKYEKLEQLRAIENEMRIFACEIDYNLKPISVDTPEDLERVIRNGKI